MCNDLHKTFINVLDEKIYFLCHLILQKKINYQWNSREGRIIKWINKEELREKKTRTKLCISLILLFFVTLTKRKLVCVQERETCVFLLQSYKMIIRNKIE
jgi:hypothetical protein